MAQNIFVLKMALLKIRSIYYAIYWCFIWTFKSQFSYFNNLINSFKDVGLCVIAAHIRPLFLDSQKIQLTILANKCLVKHLKDVFPHTPKKKQNSNSVCYWECLLLTGHCVKCFIVSAHIPSPIDCCYVYLHFTWEERGTERWSDLPRDTQHSLGTHFCLFEGCRCLGPGPNASSPWWEPGSGTGSPL